MNDSILVRFPEGDREMRYPKNPLQEGDVVQHDGDRFRVISVSSDNGHDVATVELVPDDLTDLLQSEEGAIWLAPFESGTGLTDAERAWLVGA